MLDSVRVRLTLWYSLFLACALLLLAAATYWVVRNNVRERSDENLSELADSFLTTFQNELNDASSTATAIAGAARQSMLEHRYPDRAFAVLSLDGELVVSSADLPASGTRNHRVNEDLPARAQTCYAALGTRHDFFETPAGWRDGLRCYARRFDTRGKACVLVILASLHAEHELLVRIRLAFAWIIPLTLGLAALGGYFLARRSLSPIVEMGSQADRITAANLHERLKIRNPDDELGRLAATFNRLLDRLDESFERQKQFVADASHELRTPVAILRGEAEVALAKSSRPVEEYRESLAILHQEAKRLTHIVEDLFTLTRADSGQYPLSPREFYLDELVTDCVHSVRSLALTKNLDLNVELAPELLLRADETLVRRMLLNLLDNAIKYSGVGGRVSISCRARGTQFEVAVSDSGPGIPVNLHARVFDRFFRADPARARASTNGGAGLGLSIARWIAESHNGQLNLARSDETGSVFIAVLPSGLEQPAD